MLYITINLDNMSLFDTYDDFKIRIKTLNNMGFMLGHWGSPDWYTEYKTEDIFKRYTRKCHWKPCRKFYEYFDEDNQIVVLYFPKGFDAYINWSAMGLSGKNVDFSKSAYVVAYDDSDDTSCGRFDAIATPVKTIIDIECVIMQTNKLLDLYYKEEE